VDSKKLVARYANISNPKQLFKELILFCINPLSQRLIILVIHFKKTLVLINLDLKEMP